VHRLDKDTSGLMVAAKNDLSHHLLSEQIKTRVFERHYNAIIWGNIFPKTGQITGYMDRSRTHRLKMELTNDMSGKYSCTNYSVLEEFGEIASLIDCKLDTGRTHQIRVHFTNQKHPLIGDQLYNFGKRKIKAGIVKNPEFIENFPRQALHSKTIEFFHPITGERMYFESDLPEDMKRLMEELRK
jgi:23S rRNA pseudouridine1911/1915/1917 synthase